MSKPTTLNRYNPPTEEQFRTSWNTRMRRHSAGRYVKFTDYSALVDKAIDLDIERHDNQVLAEMAEDQALRFAKALAKMPNCQCWSPDGKGHAPGCVVAEAEELVKQQEGN